MSRKPPKTAVVAFKVEEELAEFLNKLPNKSAFIRKAIAAQLGMACPLCDGKGIVPKGVHDHYAQLLEQFNSRHCDGCGDELPLPLTVAPLFPAAAVNVPSPTDKVSVSLPLPPSTSLTERLALFSETATCSVAL